MNPPTLLRLATVSLLPVLGSACRPIGAADPLERGRQPLATIATIPSFSPHDEDRILHDHTIRIEQESPQGTATKTHAGTTVTSEW
jgi:hypothetical protein